MSILIIMATYNGARFLPEQLASIRAQSYTDWRLLVRDDGSTDDTLDLLREQARTEPRIELLTTAPGRLGVLGSFSRLIQTAVTRGTRYLALADQDDVWHADKLERQMAAMRALEGDDDGRPCLVYSDLQVVDRDLRELSPSFLRFQGLRYAGRTPLSTCLLQNHVTGCTILANHALLACATPLPVGLHMHDWWLALCAHALGESRLIPEPLVRYRQHDQNRVGAKGMRELLARPRRWRAWLAKMACLYRAGFYQAQTLGAQWPDAAGGLGLERRRAVLDGFLRQGERSGLGRVSYLLRHGVHAQHPATTVLFYLQSLLLSPAGHEQDPAFEHGCRERGGAPRGS